MEVIMLTLDQLVIFQILEQRLSTAHLVLVI